MALCTHYIDDLLPHATLKNLILLGTWSSFIIIKLSSDHSVSWVLIYDNTIVSIIYLVYSHGTPFFTRPLPVFRWFVVVVFY